MKKITSILILFASLFSLSKDNYIFDENRIRTVFSEYELIDYESAPQIWLDLVDRENDIRIQISNYRNGDSEEASKKRFNTSAINSYFTPIANTVNLSSKYFGVPSISYIKTNNSGIRRREDIFFQKIKVSIEYMGGNEDYENALHLLNEAIDQSASLKNRTKRTFSKNYSIENFVDRRKLEANFKRVYGNIKLEKIDGMALDSSSYKVTIESGSMPRAIWIRANNNYSKKVIERRNDFEIQSQATKDADGVDHAYVHRGQDSRIMPRYFGVNAKVYENDYMLRELNIGVVGVIRYAITDKYTVGSNTFIIDGNKEEELKEYEKFLSLIKASLR